MATTRRPRWARFTRGEVAAAAGVSEKRLERDVRRGMVDPRDLRSVCRYIGGRATAPAAAREAYVRLGIALGIVGEHR